MGISESAGVYTDLQGLGALRKSARENSPEALRVVAQQFEAMFLNMIFKEMRDGKLAEDVLGGDGEEMYQELHDKQLAIHLAQTNSIGIADMLVRQLGPAQSRPGDTAAAGRAALRGRDAAYAPAASDPRLELRV